MITIKSEREMEIMRRAGRIVSRLLEAVRDEVKPGVTTADLDRFAEAFIRKEGGIPAFKGYCGFPASICASINDEVVHGIPGKRALKSGDIIGVDVGAIVEGFYSDAARTFGVGAVDEEKRRLIEVTDIALAKGIEKAIAGNRISDISHAVQSYVEKQGLEVVRQYVGHGIGTQLHEEPQVPNFGKPNQGPTIKAGMALAIEPMVNAGTHKVVLGEDGWTVRTQDGRPSSHFEDTVLITGERTEILTRNA